MCKKLSNEAKHVNHRDSEMLQARIANYSLWVAALFVAYDLVKIKRCLNKLLDEQKHEQFKNKFNFPTP
jgi:hypothetical protein